MEGKTWELSAREIGAKESPLFYYPLMSVSIHSEKKTFHLSRRPRGEKTNGDRCRGAFLKMIMKISMSVQNHRYGIVVANTRQTQITK